MDWRDRAACLTQNPELFFPIGLTGSALDQLDQAKRVCSDCVVREECLRWALDLNLDHGVWGGASEDERRSMKRRAARARALNRAKAAQLAAAEHGARANRSAATDGGTAA